MLGTHFHNFVNYGRPPYCEVHVLVFINEQDVIANEPIKTREEGHVTWNFLK
jgi:hypothetical protein